YLEATKISLRGYGAWSAPYPYPQITVIDPAWSSASGGMEYPTLFTGGASLWAPRELQSPEGVTIHECGHQFWYGLVGNNEFEEAWLDEGFNTYSNGKVIDVAYPYHCSYNNSLGMPVPGFSWFQVPAPAFPFAGVLGVPVGPLFSCVQSPERTAGRGFYLDHVKDDDLVRNGWQYLNGPSYGLTSYTRV